MFGCMFIQFIDVTNVKCYRVPALSFPTLRSPRKEQQGGQMFSFLKAVGLTPRQDESSQSKVVHGHVNECRNQTIACVCFLLKCL